MSQDEPTDLDKVFKALGNVTRRRILQLLAQGERYPYELSKTLGLTQRGVFKHLEALQEAGLIERYHGESDLGPDRVYYRLNARFGLSTSIQPDAFFVRFTRRGGASRIIIPKGFVIPDARLDVTAIRRLLNELGKVNRRLLEIDEERMRFASLRGQIIRRIEDIMNQCDWDEESCQKVRSLIDPVRQQSSETTEETVDLWTETVKQTIKLFESLFDSHRVFISENSEEEEFEDEEFIVEPE
ncbi:ArsR family transcriptional regulator [Candidatus Thorarchaeota archaeon]|nr:MAG: ArsR family transcriptional regulator [Candidatus Thorarchaeota archaeon]